MWSSITCGDTARNYYCRHWRNIPCRQSGALCAGGFLAGADIALNGAVLRSAPLLLMGSGIGSLSVSQLLAATGEMLQAAVPGKLTIATTPRPLQEIAAAWPQDDSQKRTVFTLG